MAKTRKEKEELVKSLEDKIDKAKSAVFVDYKGLKVAESEELRGKIRANDSEIMVIKNRLAKIALKNKGIEVDEDIFSRPVAITLSYQDEVAGAKEINTFAKSHENLEILGGILENGFISADKVKQLAALPSREQLYGMVVGTIAAPISGMVNVLSGSIRGLVNVLGQYRDSK